MSWCRKNASQIPAQDFLVIVIPAIEGSAINQQERTQLAVVSCRSRERGDTHVCPTFAPMTDVKPDLGSLFWRTIKRGSIDRNAKRGKKKKERSGATAGRFIYTGKRLYSGHRSVKTTASTKGRATSNRTVIRERATFFSRSINQRALGAY